MRRNLIPFFFLITAVFLSACDLISDLQSTNPTETPAPVTVTPNATAVLISTPDANIPESAASPPDSLIVWLPPQIVGPTDATTNVLLQQIDEFNTTVPDIDIRVHPKTVIGQGGILSYLRTGTGVAPTILPDLIAIPAEMLPTATNDNLIFPLTDLADATGLEQLYPAASEMGQIDAQLMGYPFALTDLPHLVYDSSVLTTTLPLTWQQLIADEDRNMVFAADGSDGAALALQFYLDADGNLFDADGLPILELDPLTVALEQIEMGRESGFFNPASSNLVTYSQAWQLFLSGESNIVRTSANFYLNQETADLPLDFTVTAGKDRPLTPLVNGWVWAVSTADPAKRTLAVELIEALVAPENLSAWTFESKMLPARRDAFAFWQQGEDPFVNFIGQELERARSMPVSTNSKIMTVLGDAVFQVVSGNKTAEEAATEAVDGLQS